MLAAKCALSIRVDALGEETNMEIGLEHRAKLEHRMKRLEDKARGISGSGKAKAKWEKYENKSEVKTYNIGADSTLPSVPKKRKFENDTDEEDVKPKISKTELTDDVSSEKKKKKKKKKHEENGEVDVTMDTTVNTSHEDMGSEKKKKKKKKKIKEEQESD